LKTKIITLESHDDLISVRDKLSWAKTPRILLVWPKYEKITLRLLDLKVLQRHADSLGAQLGLVTKRMNVRRDAESLGIPVFATTVAAQKDVWAESPPRTQRTPTPPRRDLRELREQVYVKEAKWRTSLLGRVITFTAGVAAVLALAGLFVPRAAVTLNPEAQAVTLVIPVSASVDTESVSLSGEIPAQVMSMIVSEEQTVPVLNRISIPKDKATGIAQFVNLGADEILIPAGTVVATNTLIRFATINEARLPGGADEIVEVKIEAVDAGEKGNIAAEAINIIEGALGLSAKVTNPDPTIGGANEEVPGASEEERAALREKVSSALLSKAEEQIRASLEEGDLFIADTLKLTAIQREEFTPAPGEPGAELTFSMQAEFSAHYILAQDIESLASSTLTASIPQEFSPTGEMAFTPLETPATDSDGVTRFSLQASQDTARIIDMAQVFNLIRGREVKSAALAMKETFSLQNEPQIVVTPSWWQWLPLIPFNISVVVN
jgi:hypothetical protein